MNREDFILIFEGSLVNASRIIYELKNSNIHPVVKTPNKAEYDLPVYLFDDDPKLSKICRKRLKKQGINSILKLEKKENISVAKRDIVLSQTETML